MCGTIRRALSNKASNDIMVKSDNMIAVPYSGMVLRMGPIEKTITETAQMNFLSMFVRTPSKVK
jgi:hypothetical protein